MSQSRPHKMQFRSVRHLWGVPEPWEDAYQKIHSNGYYAVECPLFLYTEEQKAKALSLSKLHNLHMVCQIHTSLPWGPKNKNMDDHIASFRKQVRDAKELGVLFVNSHSGYDGWTDQEKIHFFTQLIHIEKEEGIMVAHETHRRRALYNPWCSKAILEALPDLKITADLSHWFAVVESDLDDEMDIIELVGRHCYHIHARVGHSQGPQVPDPRAPEWLPWVEAHERCWDVIWRMQHAAKKEFTYYEPEFGPPPYCPTLPWTNVPVTNVWDVCEWVVKRGKERFEKLYS